MTNKNVFSTNLKRYMALKGISRKDLSKELGISYYTVTDWVNGKKYPRMDKVEMIANFFGILKSDLIEEKSEAHIEMQKNNDTITDVVVKMRTDKEFFSIVECLLSLDAEKLSIIKQTALAFKK